MIALAALSLVTAAALAEGPGTRLRTTPEIAAPVEFSHPPAPPTSRACEGLRDEARQRCLRQSRDRDADQKTTGPEATGMGSGAGSSANSGTTGGASFGGSAPR